MYLYIQGGLRRRGMTPAYGSAHACNVSGRTGMHPEAASATVLPRGALKHTILS